MNGVIIVNDMYSPCLLSSTYGYWGAKRARNSDEKTMIISFLSDHHHSVVTPCRRDTRLVGSRTVVAAEAQMAVAHTLHVGSSGRHIRYDVGVHTNAQGSINAGGRICSESESSSGARILNFC